MTDKVIEFPKHKVVRDVPSDVIEERNRRADQKLADTIVDELTGIMITELDNYYVDVQDKQFTKDFILVIDSLKAAVYRSFGFDHHLHPFIDDNVKLIEGNANEMTKEELQAKINEIMEDLTKAKAELDDDEE
jgi:hypothetical protein